MTIWVWRLSQELRAGNFTTQERATSVKPPAFSISPFTLYRRAPEHDMLSLVSSQ